MTWFGMVAIGRRGLIAQRCTRLATHLEPATSSASPARPQGCQERHTVLARRPPSLGAAGTRTVQRPPPRKGT